MQQPAQLQGRSSPVPEALVGPSPWKVPKLPSGSGRASGRGAQRASGPENLRFQAHAMANVRQLASRLLFCFAAKVTTLSPATCGEGHLQSQ